MLSHTDFRKEGQKALPREGKPNASILSRSVLDLLSNNTSFLRWDDTGFALPREGKPSSSLLRRDELEEGKSSTPMFSRDALGLLSLGSASCPSWCTCILHIAEFFIPLGQAVIIDSRSIAVWLSMI